ncbi:hypothetical protein CASFOL_010723 [Castilleja foliolosa]|uniref:Uncharacterized protein n=1 Tax=Castilleja foliolosa TaxID=1961234 RepID=A0ABD3DTX5_9LAMI
MSFSRSRSGRLQTPTLEFWRNQRAIYGLDRTITGIEEGRINPDPQMKGNQSTPRGKRKRRQPS